MAEITLGINDLLVDKRDAILHVAEQYGASNVRIFGSVARGEAGPDSDIDLLVDFKPGYQIGDLIGLKQDLEKLLGCKVDVVNAKDLREDLREYVAPDITPLDGLQSFAPKRRAFVRDHKLYLRDILACIGYIETDTAGGKEAFMTSRLIRDAVIRNFEIIGEAAKQLPAALLHTQPSVNWSKVTGFRDVLIHQYHKIDPEIVWQIIEEELAPLKVAVETMLKSLEEVDKSDQGC